MNAVVVFTLTISLSFSPFIHTLARAFLRDGMCVGVLGVRDLRAAKDRRSKAQRRPFGRGLCFL